MKQKIVLASLAFLMIAAMCMPVSAWGPLAHQNSAQVAAENGGLGPTAVSNAVAGSTFPDTQFPWDWPNHGILLIAGHTQTVASQAKTEFFTYSGTYWAAIYGNATHYMTDASMPYHTSVWPNSVIQKQAHDAYENHVASEWSHFRRIMRGAGVTSIPNTATGVQTTTDSLVSLSSSSASYLDDQYWNHPTTWESDPQVQLTLDNLVYTATANNRGMLNYIRTP
jgi:hypothetical protein